MNPSFKNWVKQRSPRMWGLARGVYYKLRLAFYPRRIVTHTYAGIKLRVVLADPVASSWYDCDWGVATELRRLMERRLKPGARVFNLGAHQCVVAMILAETVGREGKVLAVEASSHDAEMGERNRKLNGYENLEILKAAVGESSGRITFTVGGHVHRGDDLEGRISIGASSIDDLAARYGTPDVIFMDIEGYEVDALRGASRVLEANADWFIEVHVGEGLEAYGGSAEEVFSFFPAQRFERMIRSEMDPDFVPLEPRGTRLKSRFFFLAFAK
jgi:FkbM family methyltransferase